MVCLCLVWWLDIPQKQLEFSSSPQKKPARVYALQSVQNKKTNLHVQVQALPPKYK